MAICVGRKGAEKDKKHIFRSNDFGNAPFLIGDGFLVFHVIISFHQ